MPRRVQVEVGRNGQVKMDFSGFEGETCYDEADALRRALKEMGLWAIPLTVTPKPSAEVGEEAAEKKTLKKKVPLA